MAGSGEIYAEVNASVVNNGIMTLATSGEIGEEGDAGTVVVWLHWRYDETDAGFTGKNWYWDDSLNPLKTNWSLYKPEGYGDTESEFNRWLRETNPNDLDTFLGDWYSVNKASFCTNHNATLGVWSSTNPDGCIEYRGY